MLRDAPITTFLATADPDRARAFYEHTLGLRFVRDDGFALLFELGGGVPLRIARVERAAPPPYTALGWRVADVTPAVRALAAVGVRFERYDGMEQDDDGVWTSPGGGRIAWFRDPDGHILSISST